MTNYKVVMAFKYSFLRSRKNPTKGNLTINEQLKIEVKKIETLYKGLNLGISLKLLNSIYGFMGFFVALVLSVLVGLYIVNLSTHESLGPLTYILFFLLILCVFFCTLSIRIKWQNIPAAYSDYIALRSFRSALHTEHKKFVADYKELELKSAQTNKKDISEEIHTLSTESSERINELTKKLIAAIKAKGNKEVIFKVIYNGSHITNSFTRVLNIGSTTAFIFENKASVKRY